MTTINLKDFYSWYTHDEYIEVSDEVAAEVAAAEGVNESAVRHAVERGLKNMKNYLKNCQ